MSGKKQHFIPQMLLRGFGIPRGKQTYVNVYPYRKDRFSAATDGVGAMRYFYSVAEGLEQDPTLDDEITEHENSIKKILDDVRCHNLGSAVEGRNAAALVTHLCIRNAHFRNVATDAVLFALSEATAVFDDRNRTREMLGLHNGKPTKALIDPINDMIELHRLRFQALGMDDNDAREWALANAATLFEQNFDQLAFDIRKMTNLIESEAADMSKKAQINALRKELAPEVRVAALAKLCWRIEENFESEYILPDCVAIALTPHGPLPASFAGADETAAIAMPVSAKKILIGSKNDQTNFDLNINSTMASCAWDFFVARSTKQELNHLQDKLRTIPLAFFTSIINDSILDI